MKPKKRKKMMSIELKREIIEKYEQGLRVTDLARMYGRSTSMISTMLKQKELLKAITPAKGVTIISKLRTSFHAKMENLLLEWMAETQLEGEILTQSTVCEKARAIYSYLLKHNSTNEEPRDSFKASRGWFVNFRKRNGIHMKSAEMRINPLSELIEAKKYDIYQPHVTTSDLSPAWKKLWLEAAAAKRTFEALEPEVFIIGEIVSLRKSTVRERYEIDMNDELDEDPCYELTIDQLHDLHSRMHTEVRRRNIVKEEPEMEELQDTEDVKEILGM